MTVSISVVDLRFIPTSPINVHTDLMLVSLVRMTYIDLYYDCILD